MRISNIILFILNLQDLQYFLLASLVTATEGRVKGEKEVIDTSWEPLEEADFEAMVKNQIQLLNLQAKAIFMM